MRNQHVDVEGATVHFTFKGKSGIRHTIDLNDRRLARIVKRCLDLPGYELFQYLDEVGAQRTVDASDVNDYLATITGQHFTAKDFRTWAGTVLTCGLLRETQAFETESEAKKNVVRAIAAVAGRLGNTPTVCRKCYVHPAVIASYMAGEMGRPLRKQVEQAAAALRDEELDLLHLLERRLKAAA
jgi:DNA topoisomerase-1